MNEPQRERICAAPYCERTTGNPKWSACPAHRCVLHDRPVLATHGLICEHHDDLLRGWLADVEDWLADAGTFLLPGSAPSPDGSKHTKKPDAPAPVRLEVLAISDPRTKAVRPRDMQTDGSDIPHVTAVMGSWAALVVEEHPRGHVTGSWSEVLRRNHEWVTEQEWIDDYATELRDCQFALAKVVGEATGPRPVGVCPNPDCGTNVYSNHEIERWASRRERRDMRLTTIEQVDCKGCGASWKGAAIVRLRLMQGAS